MLKPKKQFIIFILFLALLTVPLVVSARGLVPCGGYLDNGQPEPRCSLVDIFVLAARMTNYLIGLAGIYAVYLIIFAGFSLVTAMGNEESIKQKKDALSNALVGFILAMMAFLFVNTVVNLLLRSKCEIDLTNPLQYLTISDYNDPKCPQK